MTTGKTIALTVQTFVSKIMFLPFNVLSRFVTDFLLRSKCLSFIVAITVRSDFGAQESKICHCFHFIPFYFHEMTVPDAMIRVFLNVEFYAS